MSDTMKAVLDRWTEDPSFRTALRTDVPGALTQAGISVDDETTSQLAALDWTLTDQELEELIEKRLMC